MTEPDPQADAERRLRLAMAAEARAERDLLGKIQKGFYGCLTIILVLFVLALFFF
ncbi:MAG TPA: hypothetical protein VGD07_15655 [Methylomirabilota bacterium]